MKIEKINVEKEKVFEPITIAITIESKRDLEFFWALTNVSKYETVEIVNKAVKDMAIKDFDISEFNLLPLWQICESILKPHYKEVE